MENARLLLHFAVIQSNLVVAPRGKALTSPSASIAGATAAGTSQVTSEPVMADAGNYSSTVTTGSFSGNNFIF